MGFCHLRVRGGWRIHPFVHSSSHRCLSILPSQYACRALEGAYCVLTYIPRYRLRVPSKHGVTVCGIAGQSGSCPDKDSATGSNFPAAGIFTYLMYVHTYEGHTSNATRLRGCLAAMLQQRKRGPTHSRTTSAWLCPPPALTWRRHLPPPVLLNAETLTRHLK